MAKWTLTDQKGGKHAMLSYPDNNPKTQYGEAKPKMSDTPTISVKLLGQVHTMGADKYGAFNWREHKVSSTVYYDAAMRHLMAYFDGEDTDPESQLPHLAHIMACCSILLDAEHHQSLNDNRPKLMENKMSTTDITAKDFNPSNNEMVDAIKSKANERTEKQND